MADRKRRRRSTRALKRSAGSGRAAQSSIESLAARLWPRRLRSDARRRGASTPARIAVRVSQCPLSLSGIAKGYIVERACDLAIHTVRGVRGILLNVGGDLCARGDVPQTIGIAAPWADSESSEPLAFIAVKDRSVSTSGSSQRGFRISGEWYSHVIDPRSGRPVEHVKSATVVAPKGADADALAKICNVLKPEESLRLLRQLPDVECLIVQKDGHVAESAGWRRHERPSPAAVALARAPAASSPAVDAGARVDSDGAKPEPWDPQFELAVNFEINRPQAERGRYRRPYVAIWVEDKDGNPVRTLVLWVSLGGSGPFQWLPDLKRWYTREEERKQVERNDVFLTTARPTREPGRYKVIWDGKDNHGKQLGRGRYTLYIEAAREHGTYQSMHKEVALSDQPFLEDLKGNVEIKSATIEYRRKAQTK